MDISRWRSRLCLVFVLALAGAGVAGGVASGAQESSACVRAADFGAIPNDGADDRERLQAAINAAQAGPRCLELGAGKFQVTRKPEGGGGTAASLTITSTLSLFGAGAEATVLAMVGSGTCPGCPPDRNWRLLEIVGASDVSVSGLMMDGSERTETSEQTHLLQVTGPTEHVVIERITFNLPEIGPDAGGDCIRLKGEATTLVRDTTIRDTRGVNCDRSFVSLQRALDGVVIERSETVRVGDQVIDFEPTNRVECEPSLRNVFMRGLTLRKGDNTGRTMFITGEDCAVADNVTLTDSVIEDGGVEIIDARNVTLSRVHVRSVAGNPLPPLEVGERIANLRVLDSVIERVAESGPGSAILLRGNDAARPADVMLSGIRVLQATPGPLVDSRNVERPVIVGAELVYEGAPVGDPAIVVLGSNRAPVESPVVVDTTVRGPLAGAIAVEGRVGAPVLVRVTGP